MANWYVKTKGADFNAWARELRVDPMIARLIRNRDITSIEEARSFLYGNLQECHSPWMLKDMDAAVNHLIRAVTEQKKIRVIGDYDVDGISSSYILASGIARIGGEVDVAIPHRIHDGYGLNENLIDKAAQDGIQLIITCDNGISAKPQIKHAKDFNIDVIVTDHHEVPYETEGDVRREILPEALAVVDPKREEDQYPFSGICGAVVAYKYMQALADQLEKQETSSQLFQKAALLKEGMEEYLEFAALATVCDVMELRDENRIIVREGILRMRNSRNKGMKALMDVCGISGDDLSAFHFGFVLGPCLNATGRLDNAQRALDLLNCKDYSEAVNMARELKDMNDGRKNMTLEGTERANEVIKANHMENDKVLVVYLPTVHESLAGIIAGRIREQYGHPAFVLTRSEDCVKGSGRSIECYHMYEALSEVSHLLKKFGGHKQAAGLSLDEENVDRLREELNANCKLSEKDFVPNVYIDMELPMSYPNLEIVEQIQVLEPFGTANEKPLFVQRDVEFLSAKRMGSNGQFGRFQVRIPDGDKYTLIYFGDMNSFLNDLDAKYGAGSADRLLAGGASFAMHVVYMLSVNEYNGNRTVQYQMKYYR